MTCSRRIEDRWFTKEQFIFCTPISVFHKEYHFSIKEHVYLKYIYWSAKFELFARYIYFNPYTDFVIMLDYILKDVSY